MDIYAFEDPFMVYFAARFEKKARWFEKKLFSAHGACMGLANCRAQLDHLARPI